MDEETAPDPATEARSRRAPAGSDASTIDDGPVDPSPTASTSPGDLREAVVEALRTLPTQSKLVLLAVLARDANGEGASTTGEVYNAYEGLCADSPIDPLSQRRVTDLLDELDTFGLVSAVVVSEGRYGRTREIEGSVAAGPARDVLLADEQLRDVAGD